jgi:hypothetical protein
MSPWSQKIREHNHELGSLSDAAGKRRGDGGFSKFHMGWLDDCPGALVAKCLDNIEQQGIAFIASRAMIDQDHGDLIMGKTQ